MPNLLDLFFPAKCIVCGDISEETSLCPKCRQETFQYYGESKELDIPNYLALFKYSPSLKKIIESLKYHNNKKILPLLQEEIIKHTPTYAGLEIIIPVPLNPMRLQERGFDQAYELIRPYATLHNIPVRTDIVFREYNTQKLYSLDKSERLKETADVFDVWINKGDDITGKSIMLFDDILTTGGTIKNVLNVLSEFKPKNMITLAFSRPVKEKL